MSSVKYVKHFVNKNPRNMEMLRLLRKPNGWEFEKDRTRKNFIYRVDFVTTKNSTTATVIHFEQGKTVIEASTNEKSVRNQLYSPTDVSAAQNIGRLIARRCAMAGIKYLTSGITEEELEGSKRRSAFINALEESGIILFEPESIPHTHINDPNLTWESFPFKHTRDDKLDELDLELEPGKGVC
ncbi:hypothetical protein Mgra_00001634 [Meloidogyne graminicola]|uniref:Large ribosomal subunit protein uL18m n=1 Tax=Meloidogyne graminicola TaxID=189291 RepID=A0A8T0A0L6_9BILA|nr:hypothetical protein Mgra_00001634 [Meloidogyne graminicola]